MHQRTKKLAAAIGIAGLAVVGFDTYTFAGTGDSLILGKFNKANKTTHVTSTGKGPALSLHAKGDRPALAVDSRAKIVRLNADRVDDWNAAGLQNNVRVYTRDSGSSTNGGMLLELPNFPSGRYIATYSVYMAGAQGSTANPTSATCYFRRSRVGAWSAESSTTAIGVNFASLSGSDVINKDSSGWGLFCGAYQPGVGADDWSISSTQPIRVTLTKIDMAIGGNLDLAAARSWTDARHPER